MSDRPIGLGKVAENGTLNENGAFYSVQDINVLLEEKGGGGGDLPTPTVADAGKVVVVDGEGKYALGDGGALYHVTCTENNVSDGYDLNKSYNDLSEAISSGKLPYISLTVSLQGGPLVIGTLSSLYDNGEGRYIAEFNMGDKIKYNFEANDPNDNLFASNND